MELNYCLYCEKLLKNDKMAFCSVLCQSNEASKTCIYTSPNNPPQSSRISEAGLSYQLSYHRRPSLSYSLSAVTTHAHHKKSNDKRTYSTSLTMQRSPFFLVQSISSSSSLSSLSDVSVFSTSCSCEDKNVNVCAPYHHTRTTHNIAS
ncbi:hypothetical protein BDB01DRAFT_853645 [Pilobolus umbonatus]|nr:hypothetical protein BDB01DRAFT_853645 [Pilobolus umbonatus]